MNGLPPTFATANRISNRLRVIVNDSDDPIDDGQFRISSKQMSEYRRQFGSLEMQSPSFKWLDSIRTILSYEEFHLSRQNALQLADADVFVWTSEKPKKNYATQIGGMPFVQAGFAWPCISEEPLDFVGSVYFGDSLDLVDVDLPGDVLNLFLSKKGIYAEDFSAALWANSASCQRLDRADVPESTQIFHEIYGYAYRTKIGYRLRDDIPEPEIPSARRWLSETPSMFTAITGRLRFLESYTPFPFNSKWGTLIATFCPVNPDRETELACTFNSWGEQKWLTLNPGGVLLIFLDRQGIVQVGWHI